MLVGVSWPPGSWNNLDRPLLDPVFFALFVVGLVVATRRVRKLGYALPLMMLGVALVPDYVAFQGVAPNAYRIFLLVGPVALLAGVGGCRLARGLARRRPGKRIVIASLFLLSVEGSWGIQHQYFVVWHSAEVEQTGLIAHTEESEARYLLDEMQPVLVPLREYERPRLRYLASARYSDLSPVAGTTWDEALEDLTSTVAVLIPTHSLPSEHPENPYSWVLFEERSAYLLPPLPSRAVEAIRQLRLTTSPSQTVRTPQGREVAKVYETRWTHLLPPGTPILQQELGIRFSEGLVLEGQTIIDREASGGAELKVVLFWGARRAVREPYQVSVKLLDDSLSEVWSEALRDPMLGVYPTTYWRSDDIVPTFHRMEIPLGIAAGRYWIEVSVYSGLDFRRLRIASVADGRGADRALLGPVKVPRVPVSPEDLEGVRPLAARLGESILLRGYRLQTVDHDHIESIQLGLVWESLRSIDLDYTVFVHVLDSGGRIAAQVDRWPAEGTYPTSIWTPGEVILDTYYVEASALPSGEYHIEVGMYLLETLRRMPVQDALGRPLPEDRILIEDVIRVGGA